MAPSWGSGPLSTFGVPGTVPDPVVSRSEAGVTHDPLKTTTPRKPSVLQVPVSVWLCPSFLKKQYGAFLKPACGGLDTGVVT